MNFDFAALERRIIALEESQTASLRFGRCTAIEGGKVRVQFRDGQGMNSYLLSTVQRRVLRDKAICMPDVGEPLAVLFSGQGCEQAVVIGAYYNGREEDPGVPQEYDYVRYEDGTEIWYDRTRHKLVANVKGDCELTAEKTIKASCREEAEIRTEKTLTAYCREEAEIHSEREVTIRAPKIVLRGHVEYQSYDGTGEGSASCANLHLRGNLDVDGDIIANHISERR